MALRRRNILGLMVNGRSVTAADLRLGSGEQPVLQAVTRFALTDDLSWDEPAKIGAALAEHLKTAGIRAKHAIVGLPAAWILTRSVAVPPAQGETLRKLVANKAERAFAGGGKDMVIDFVTAPSEQAMGEPHALLVATQQQRVDATVAMAEAAGLSVDSVTATSAVLASIQAGDEAEPRRSLTLTVSEDASELAVHNGRHLQTIRSLRKPPSADAAGNILAGQLRQIRMLQATNADDASAAPAAASPAGDGSQDELWLWDGIGLDDDARQLIAAEAGPSRLQQGRLDEWVHANGALAALNDTAADGRYAGAVALACAGLDRAHRPVDWLHSRLAEPKKRAVNQPTRIAIIAAAVVLIAALSVTLHYRAAAATVAELETQLATMQDDVTASQQIIQRVDQAEAWFADRPSVLGCLEALTGTFGDDSGIWASEISLQEGLSGTVAGAASDSRRALDLRDRMDASPAFTNVALVYLRESDRNSSGQIGWAITFQYVQPGRADDDTDADTEPDTLSEF